MEIGTITRRMEFALSGLDHEFRSLYDIADFRRKISALKAAGTKSNRPSILAELFSMFDSCGIQYEKGRDNTYYEELVEHSDIATFLKIEDRMLQALFTRYQEYPAPEDYIKRIVERMTAPEDDWTQDTTRVKILKQFIKYGDYLAKAGFGGRNTIRDYVKKKIEKKPSEEDVLQYVDDELFAVLESATKAQKKPDGKFGLLKLADDLATGKFRAEGATKKGLYLFAMVYGMTYYSGSPVEVFNDRTDIEKNLFRDYYANNLMRFITDVYRGRSCEFEVDPSGQGINYKNFAEMIYLYYISSNYSSQDKIRLSHEMINRIQEKQFKQGRPEALTEAKETQYFKGRFFRGADTEELFSEDILVLPEEEFENFICENYNCDVYTETYETKKGSVDGKTGVMQLETEQNTAFENYNQILQDLKDLGVSLENCNYGLWFTDVAAFKKKGYQDLWNRNPEIDRSKFDEFIELLLGINNFLGNTVEEEISEQNENQEWAELSKRKTKALFVSSPSAVTRTSMLVAYYYYYNALHEDDEDDRWKNFEELFNNFKSGIDDKLERSNYQLLSGRNIFDVLVVFSSYAYLNM